MADPLTLADFAPHVGSTFQIVGAEDVLLVLTQAASLIRPGKRASTQTAAPREPFDLIFVGPLAPILPQQIHVMESAGTGRLEIFIVPIGPLDGGMGYQAIFN